MMQNCNVKVKLFREMCLTKRKSILDTRKQIGIRIDVNIELMKFQCFLYISIQ